MRHTISVLVENKFGVLTRVAGLFSGRGYNIDTLNVAPTQDADTSRMTIVTRGDDATLDQIVALRASGSLPQNVNFAVKADYLMPLLRSVGAQTTVRVKRPADIPEVVSNSERSVVLVIAR